MAEEYNPEQIFKLLGKLPEELKEVFFSQKTADYIDNICKKYELLDERASKIAEHVGQVLLGILPLDEFQTALDKEVGLKKDIAQKVAQEINQSIFDPIKDDLENPYKASKEKKTTESKKYPSLKEEAKKPPGKDVYREVIE